LAPRIVDQAEELITLSGEAERADFLDLLASALDAGPRLWIIMIMQVLRRTPEIPPCQSRHYAANRP
jgi:hypothetical protein